MKSVKAQSAENNSQFHFGTLAVLVSAQAGALSSRAKRGTSQLLTQVSRRPTVTSPHLALRVLLSLSERIEVRVRWQQLGSEISRLRIFMNDLGYSVFSATISTTSGVIISAFGFFPALAKSARTLSAKV